LGSSARRGENAAAKVGLLHAFKYPQTIFIMTDNSCVEVDLWLSPEPLQLDAHKARQYEAMLSAAEKQRWQRFLQAGDRDRFLHARALTRTVLARYLGDVEPAALAFSQGSWGKPTLAHSAHAQGRQERMPFFNLSHTRGMAVLAVTAAAEIGVDVESIDRRVEVLALSERYFSAREHEQILQLSDRQQRERFFAVWTLKEAYLKARGLGLRLALDSFSFDCSTLAIHLEESEAAHSGGGWRFRLLEQGEFRIALALQHKSAASLIVHVRQGQPGDTFLAIQ
jgi:4'-phosphopantetheinyl transferase